MEPFYNRGVLILGKRLVDIGVPLLGHLVVV